MQLQDKVVLSEWRPDWAIEFSTIAGTLTTALGSEALRIDHIGSTSVPNLPAKDIIDVQVIVTEIDSDLIIGNLRTVGFIQKYGDWNARDHIPAGWVGDPDEWAKLVFATPQHLRPGNIHIRVAGSPNERYALLFRDFLSADRAAREAWGRFKTELAVATENLADYGAVKDPATDLLLALAERWAQETAWMVANP
jgi:dephospho-CoA kinase